MEIYMKVLYLKWGYRYDDAVIRAFQAAGLETEEIFLSEQFQDIAGDIVFSVNFFAEISAVCQREGVPYCSWVLQLPNFDLYTEAVRNSCNYIGVCDSYLAEKLWQMGVSKAFFLPDAVEAYTPELKPVEREACFVARRPVQEAWSMDKISAYGKGYLDAFIHGQRVLFGANVLENGLLLKVQKEFVEDNPIPEEVLPECRRLYLADRYFAPACTALQQDIFLQNFASIMTIYSDGEFEGCDSSVKRPYVDDEEKRREIFAGKEFTLVLAPHILHNGIPRELLEVIVAGGFPLAGFQKDYGYFFERDENLVYFTSPSEFSQAVVRYGNSAEERERVRRAAYQTVIAGHTYQHRVVTMLEMWERL
ncbi:MAG: glycosyltransferase [Butyrivibrio sp.]|nr:glycosyltransferase [Muribaculum sp.]MCM1553016.1 glycosyltransferase [Butyrivibrio sp.]